MSRRERPDYQKTDIHHPFDTLSELKIVYSEFKKNTIDRREFLRRASLVTATLILPVLQVKAVQLKPDDESQYSIEPWSTLFAVQQHLLPSEPNSPGAKEINATEYLKNVLKDNFLDKEDKEFILNGPVWLNDLSNSQFEKTFVQLNSDQQNAMLKQVAKSTAGENWLATLLSYIFEALLAAPIYGGNPKGIGWRWLKHQPGFPLPEKKSLTWQQLQKR